MRESSVFDDVIPVVGSPLRQLQRSGASLFDCLDCMQPKLLLLQSRVSELGSVNFEYPLVLLRNCFLPHGKLPLDLLEYFCLRVQDQFAFGMMVF